MDKFCKLWKKTEITSENQNDAKKKRKHVNKAKSTEKEQKEQNFTNKGD